MSRKYHLLRKFGITEEQYDFLYREQAGCCAICGRSSDEFKSRLAVDHDHTSQEIRGLLCFNCNKFVVGRRRKGEGARLLRLAAEYLDREYVGWVVPPKPKKRKKKHGKKHRVRRVRFPVVPNHRSLVANG